MTNIRFEDWRAEQMLDPAFREAVKELEPEYDAARIRGVAKIELRDVATGEVDTWESHNTVVDNGLNLILERLINTTGASPIGNLAIGSGTRSTINTAGSLAQEVFRKAITAASVSSSVTTFKTYFTTAQANTTIRELGLTNSSASGQGTLFNYIEVNPAVVKTSAKEALITITTTISRA